MPVNPVIRTGGAWQQAADPLVLQIRHARPELTLGIRRSRDDLLAELADVIITVAVAMTGVAGGDAGGARSHLELQSQTPASAARLCG
jgi:hypothetical protein